MATLPQPPAGVTIRDLRPSDLDDLRELYYLCYDERDQGVPIGITLFRDRPSPAEEATWFAGLLRRVLERSCVVSVAEVGGHAVGSCTISRPAASPTSESAHLGELGILVHRDFRGRGIGAALLKDALLRARELFEVVRLSVFSTNVRAQQLYSRFGFRPAGRIPRAVRRGDRYFDEELMVLVFDPRPRPATNR